MLTSLFGALYSRRTSEEEPSPGQDFAPTMLLESPPGFSLAPGRDPRNAPARDLLLRDSSGDELCRQLLSEAPGTLLGRAAHRITLFDPAGCGAGEVVKRLSDASGEPLERFYLRRPQTLSTLAMVERTALPRRFAESLQISHVEVRSDSLREAATCLALLGRSHMAVVMLAPMAPTVLDQLLTLLHDMVQRNEWSCPNLLLLGSPPPSTLKRLASLQWPAALNVEFGTEAVVNASSAWNAILGSWNRMKLLPQRLTPPPAVGIAASSGDAPASPRRALTRVTAGGSATALPPGGTTLRPARSRHILDRSAMAHALETLISVRGVLGAAVVDSTSGLVLGRQHAAHGGAADLDRSALMLSEVLKAHRRTTLGSSSAQPIQEVLVTQSFALQLLRTLSLQPQIFLFVVLDRAGSNLALVRHAVAQAEKSLG